jgi:predicted dithiol-disulfide oxidoreductase (DUF899 family)
MKEYLNQRIELSWANRKSLKEDFSEDKLLREDQEEFATLSFGLRSREKELGHYLTPTQYRRKIIVFSTDCVSTVHHIHSFEQDDFFVYQRSSSSKKRESDSNYLKWIMLDVIPIGRESMIFLHWTTGSLQEED